MRFNKRDLGHNIYNRKHVIYIIVCFAMSVLFQGKINTFFLFVLYPLLSLFLIIFYCKKKKLKRIVLGVFYLTTFIMLITSTFFSNMIVSGDSMSPTLKNGDCKFVLQQNYFIRNEDIVIASVPNQTDSKQRVKTVKRVIAQKGDKVEFVYEIFYTKMIINNYELRIKNELVDLLNIHIKESVIIDDVYFLLGDNLGVSYDSRYYGFVHKNNLLGKVLF